MIVGMVRPMLCIAQEPKADELLSTDMFALLLGMMLDQQYPLEHAFRGPFKLAERMGGFDLHRIATAEPTAFEDLAATPPGIHRYGRSMARRAQQLARHIIDTYDGDTTGVWTRDHPDAAEVLRRLKDLPGFGDQKARIFLALLGKQLGVTPEGWQAAAGAYAEPGSRRSVADITDAQTLQEVRAFKKQMKALAAQAQPASGS